MRNRQPALVIAQRRLRVAALFLQRMRMVDIAADPGVNVAISTVSKDIKALKKAWLDESLEHIATVKGRELAELDQMERDASALFALAARWRIGRDGQPENLPNHTRAQGWQFQRLKIKELRAKILGMLDPDRAPVTPGDVEFEATVTAEGVIVCREVEVKRTELELEPPE